MACTHDCKDNIDGNHITRREIATVSTPFKTVRTIVTMILTLVLRRDWNDCMVNCNSYACKKRSAGDLGGMYVRVA